MYTALVLVTQAITAVSSRCGTLSHILPDQETATKVIMY